jgi:hypothetical protein
LSSGEEDSNNQAKLSSSMLVKTEENDLPLNDTQNGETNAQNQSPVNSTIKYVFKEWDIKESDCEKDNFVLNRRSPETNDQKNVSNNEDFEINIKNFRLGKNVLTDHKCTLLINADGLHLTYLSKLI